MDVFENRSATYGNLLREFALRTTLLSESYLYPTERMVVSIYFRIYFGHVCCIRIIRTSYMTDVYYSYQSYVYSPYWYDGRTCHTYIVCEVKKNKLSGVQLYVFQANFFMCASSSFLYQIPKIDVRILQKGWLVNYSTFIFKSRSKFQS